MRFGPWLAAVPVILLTACGGAAGEPRAGERIVYSLNVNGYQSIHSIAPDGSDPVQLTEQPSKPTDNSGSHSPGWSPDGTKIVYVSGGDSSEEDATLDEIYVMNADGSDKHRLTRDEFLDASPAWSPDGTKIAYTRYTSWDSDGPPESVIVVMNADGSDAREITSYDPPRSEFVLDGDPVWVPDGSRIAFARAEYVADAEDWDDATGGRYTIAPDGTDQQPLELLDEDDGDLEWSPDGTKIVFASVRDKFGETCFHDCSPNGEIYIANADGTNARRLTENEASDDSPTWSPDGRQILFVSDRSDPDAYAYDLYVMPAEGGTPTRITDSSLDWAIDPDWR